MSGFLFNIIVYISPKDLKDISKKMDNFTPLISSMALSIIKALSNSATYSKKNNPRP
jgi:hypothetical protein